MKEKELFNSWLTESKKLDYNFHKGPINEVILKAGTDEAKNSLKNTFQNWIYKDR